MNLQGLPFVFLVTTAHLIGWSNAFSAPPPHHVAPSASLRKHSGLRSTGESDVKHRAKALNVIAGPAVILESISSPADLLSILSSFDLAAGLPAVLRASTSALLTYTAILASVDRPRGKLNVGDSQVRVQPSTVPGAGMGLFALADLSRGTVLGTYPGVVVPLEQHVSKLRLYPASEGYIWRFSDNRMVIDPTNPRGMLEDTVCGGNLSQPGSVFLFEFISKLSLCRATPTTLCRINEPPRGSDVNVVTEEDLVKRTVTFTLERDVYKGEELFIDYGLSYDRSRYTA
jgi:hypothetical protein